jgi:hypothetical protein
VKKNLVCVASGSWRALEQASQEEVKKDARRRGLSLQPVSIPLVILVGAGFLWWLGDVGVRTLLVAGLPWAVVWMVEKTLNTKINDTIKFLVVVGWALVILLNSIQPDWIDKLNDVKKVSDLVR